MTTPEPKLGYIAFYKGRRLELYASGQLAARDEAARQFKAKKPYEVTVVLAEKDGETVIHTAVD